MIKWDFVSPTLRVASGTVHLDRIKSSLDDYKIYEQHEWEIKVEENGLSYGPHPMNKVTDRMKSIIDLMANTYLAGVTLDKTSCIWLENNEHEQEKTYGTEHDELRSQDHKQKL